MLTEFASFTPRTKSGTAEYLDLFNADLWDEESHLEKVYGDDQIQFRKGITSWRFGFATGNPNGVIQATFQMEEDGYFVGIVRMTALGADVEVYVDDELSGQFNVNEVAMDIPITAHLPVGLHGVTVLPYTDPVVGGDVWFHGITCFKT